MANETHLDMSTMRRDMEGPRQGSLGDQITRSIERRIISGEFAPGRRFPAAVDIARQIDVSPTAVRDAMTTLQARGLITVRHGFGTEVSERGHALSAALMTSLMREGAVTILDMARARAAAETQMSAVATRNGSAADWREVGIFLKGMERALEVGDLNLALDQHIRFHSRIIEAARLPVLTLLLSPLQHIALLCSLPSLQDPRQWDVEGHARILDALKLGDESKVQDEFAIHYHDIDDPKFLRYYAQPLNRMPLAAEILDSLRAAPGGNPEWTSILFGELQIVNDQKKGT